MGPRTPAYFISHGGPQTCYDATHPVYARLALLGQEILSLHPKPAALVVFGAHWQSRTGPGTVQVSNPSAPLPLIYDFYGFPAHYYKTQYAHRVDPVAGGRVLEVLRGAGVSVSSAERGLDHGVWVPFKVMFEGREEEVPPVVQVSLLDSEDAEAHLALGRAVEKLRGEGMVVVGSGMAVHNLAGLGMGLNAAPADFAVSFDEALRQAVESQPGEERDAAMRKVVERGDARRAHPTMEHLMPAHVVVGAAGEDGGKRVWTKAESSLSWAQFRFGEV